MTLEESLLKNIKQDDNIVAITNWMSNVLKLEEDKDYKILKNGKIDINTPRTIIFTSYKEGGEYKTNLPSYINFERISAYRTIIEWWNWMKFTSLDGRHKWEGMPKQIDGDVIIRHCTFHEVGFAGFPYVNGNITIEENDFLKEIITMPDCKETLIIRKNKLLSKIAGFRGKYFNPTLTFTK